jgi:hypothetical protein
MCTVCYYYNSHRTPSSIKIVIGCTLVEGIRLPLWDRSFFPFNITSRLIWSSDTLITIGFRWGPILRAWSCPVITRDPPFWPSKESEPVFCISHVLCSCSAPATSFVTSCVSCLWYLSQLQLHTIQLQLEKETLLSADVKRYRPPSSPIGLWWGKSSVLLSLSCLLQTRTRSPTWLELGWYL